MGRPRGLLLDAMGTLIGLRTSVGHTYAAAAADYGIHVDPAAMNRHFPRIYRQAPPLAFPELSDGAALDQAERSWWGERIDAVLQACGAPAAPVALHNQLFDLYGQPDRWFVYPDVLEPLRAWHARGLQLAVVSNFDSRLPGLLAGLGLAPWLAAVVVSSQAGAAKPSARPFLLALEQLGLAPSQVWHVGDSPEDGDGARAAGLSCILVRRP